MKTISGQGTLKYVSMVTTHPQELKFSILQGSCSGENILTFYSALITDEIPDTITINGFVADHVIRKKYKASNRKQEIRILEECETTALNIKKWMETMCLKLRQNRIH